jgi:hypothetical protein
MLFLYQEGTPELALPKVNMFGTTPTSQKTKSHSSSSSTHCSTNQPWSMQSANSREHEFTPLRGYDTSNPDACLHEIEEQHEGTATKYSRTKDF